MALDRAQLANVDRRLLSELNRKEDWQLVKVPASEATWSAWKRYCDVVGLSMGRAIGALIDLELGSVVDDELHATSAVIAKRQQMLDIRKEELDEREKEITWREKVHGLPRRATAAELQRMAAEIEPSDYTVSEPQTQQTQDPETGTEPAHKTGRNEPCWCGSGRKYKHCHWARDRA